MRKTHWEIVQSNDILSRSIEIVARAVAATRSPTAFRSIDVIIENVRPFVPDAFNSDNVMLSPLRSFLFYYLFRTGGGLVHRMAKDFSDELSQTKMKVPARVIPADGPVVCIEFPEGLQYSCVFIGCAEDPGVDSNGRVYKRLELQFMKPLGREDRYSRFVLHFYSQDEVVEDAADVLRNRYPNEYIPLDLIKFALNCFLYIHSGQPDLREYRPPKRPLTKKPKEQRRYDKMMEDRDGIPVVLVGYDFKKESQVGAHLQRYWTGKGRSDLIWVFKRSYTKGGPI